MAPYVRPQFWSDLDQIWHVASLYPSDGHGQVCERRFRPQACAPRAVYITGNVANGLRGPSGHSELATSNHNGSSAADARSEREGVALVMHKETIYIVRF